MKVGAPTEIKTDEYRVAITPAGVREFLEHGHEVFIQKGAGDGSVIPDEEFIEQGAQILPDAQAVFDEAALVHFSDWPLPKPWTMWSSDALAEIQPKCEGVEACAERKIWKGLYEDFRVKRRDICKILSNPAPVWTKWKADHGAG